MRAGRAGVRAGAKHAARRKPLRTCRLGRAAAAGAVPGGSLEVEAVHVIQLVPSEASDDKERIARCGRHQAGAAAPLCPWEKAPSVAYFQRRPCSR